MSARSRARRHIFTLNRFFSYLGFFLMIGGYRLLAADPGGEVGASVEAAFGGMGLLVVGSISWLGGLYSSHS